MPVRFSAWSPNSTSVPLFPRTGGTPALALLVTSGGVLSPLNHHSRYSPLNKNRGPHGAAGAKQEGPPHATGRPAQAVGHGAPGGHGAAGQQAGGQGAELPHEQSGVFV